MPNFKVSALKSFLKLFAWEGAFMTKRREVVTIKTTTTTITTISAGFSEECINEAARQSMRKGVKRKVIYHLVTLLLVALIGATGCIIAAMVNSGLLPISRAEQNYQQSQTNDSPEHVILK